MNFKIVSLAVVCMGVFASSAFAGFGNDGGGSFVSMLLVA